MNETPVDPQKIFLKALDKAADLLGRRNHSELELRQKLLKNFEEDVVERVVEEAHQRRWLLPPEELAEMAARAWSRSHKSFGYIQAQLKKRGLPIIEIDEELEIQKMKTLLQKKFRLSFEDHLDLSYEDRVRAFRYLKYRGFSDALIRKVIHEQL